MTKTGSSAVLAETKDGIGWITLNRPDQINAINQAMRDTLPLILREFDDTPEVKAVIIHGAGPRGFCAGADIKEFKPASSLVESRQSMSRGTVMDAIAETRKPIIAAIHGICLGGGLEIAMACDIRIASKEAQFGLPEVNLGLIPGGGGTQRLPRLIGLGRAMDMLLTGDRLTAEDAHRVGLISRISSDPEQLLSDAHKIGIVLASKPPLALAFVKEAARTSLSVDLERGLQIEKDLFALLTSTEDRNEAAAAFKEKRPATFVGR